MAKKKESKQKKMNTRVDFTAISVQVFLTHRDLKQLLK